MPETNVSENAELTVVRENGLILVKTPESTKQLSSWGMLAQEAQNVFQVDLGYRGNERKIKTITNITEQCPHCNSMNTMGNGTRTTQKEVQHRRICNSCHRTYAAGKVYPKTKEDITVLRGQIRLLSVGSFNPLEISEQLNISLPTVVDYLNTTKDERFKSMNQFKFAKPFDLSKIIPDKIGRTSIWDYNGSLAIKRAGNPNIIFIKKSDQKLMEQFSNEQLAIFLSTIPAKKREIIKNFIDDVLDSKLGIFPPTRQDTRPTVDCGELDVETFDDGQEKAIDSDAPEG